MLTNRLVLAIDHLSKTEMRRASVSTASWNSVRERAVHVAVGLRQIAIDVARAEQHFERALAADLPRQARHRSTTGDEAHPYFPLRQHRLFAARETHVTGQREFAAVASRPAADQGNRDDRGAGGRTRMSGQASRPSDLAAGWSESRSWL